MNSAFLRQKLLLVIAPALSLTILTATAQTPTPAPAVATAKTDLPPGRRVFSCGHSFHIWVAPIIAELALKAGIKDHRIAGRSSIGGSTVLQHWEVPDEKNDAKRLLRAGEVDTLTLSPIWLPDEGIGHFARLAHAGNPDIVITVQKYWLPNDEYHPVYPLDTRKHVDHNATVIGTLQEAQNRYDHDIDEAMKAINRELGRDAIVTVPVGQAVVALRAKIVAGECPSIKTQAELFRDSWGHVTQPVRALSAYCHFATIYRRSPVGLARPAILTSNPNWDDRLNRLLQELAWDAVKSHPMSGVPADAK
jgi:hypothetical protein